MNVGSEGKGWGRERQRERIRNTYQKPNIYKNKIDSKLFPKLTLSKMPWFNIMLLILIHV